MAAVKSIPVFTNTRFLTYDSSGKLVNPHFIYKYDKLTLEIFTHPDNWFVSIREINCAGFVDLLKDGTLRVIGTDNNCLWNIFGKTNVHINTFKFILCRNQVTEV